VSANAKTYGPQGSYHVFAGKDGSKGLGLSSTDPADAVPDYTSLNPQQLQVLDQWFLFFKSVSISPSLDGVVDSKVEFIAL
jgi:hypothetical protein